VQSVLSLLNAYVVAGPAQHGIPADRCAREIVPFLRGSHAARSRHLNANPLGRCSSIFSPISSTIVQAHQY
jgi:hypothetical protein